MSVREFKPRGSAPRASHASEASAAELLAEVQAFIELYVFLPSAEASTALALFALHSWTIGAADCTPYIVVESPQKQSGKSRLLEVLALLVRAPWRAVSASEAAFFRKIEQDCPTLLLDEVDAIFGSSTERTEPLRAALNAGNRRGASIARCVGQGEKRVEDFSVFCAKVLAGINTGKLPETIVDRAVVIHMKRRRASEHVEKFRERSATQEVQPLRERLEQWSTGATEQLMGAEPSSPAALSDRAADAWEPLFAIADLAGGEWRSRSRASAIVLSAAPDADEGRGVQLLGVIRRVMGDAHAIFTDQLLAGINADDETPFGGWSEGRGIDARTLTKQLKPYGVDHKSKTIRVGDETNKGYYRREFVDAWERYLPTPPEPSQASQASHDEEPSQKNAHEMGDVTDVTDVTDFAGCKDVDPSHNGHVDDYAERFRRDRAGGRWER